MGGGRRGTKNEGKQFSSCASPDVEGACSPTPAVRRAVCGKSARVDCDAHPRVARACAAGRRRRYGTVRFRKTHLTQTRDGSEKSPPRGDRRRCNRPFLP